MEKISIIEVEHALYLLGFEVETSEGYEYLELIRNYVEQQREKQIAEGTLIV